MYHAGKHILMVYPDVELGMKACMLNLHFLFDSLMADRSDGPIGRLPEHVIIEIFIRLPVYEWVQLACVNKHWASIFQGEYMWQTAIARNWPSAGLRKRWPGPIPRGSARR